MNLLGGRRCDDTPTSKVQERSVTKSVLGHHVKTGHCTLPYKRPRIPVDPFVKGIFFSNGPPSPSVEVGEKDLHSQTYTPSSDHRTKVLYSMEVMFGLTTHLPPSRLSVLETSGSSRSSGT